MKLAVPHVNSIPGAEVWLLSDRGWLANGSKLMTLTKGVISID